MPNKAFRIPLQEADRQRLEELLTDVPVKTVVHYDWRSEQGRLFIKELRRVQMMGVPANWIAETLNLSAAAINGALSYWERAGSRNPRARRQRKAKARRLRTEE